MMNWRALAHDERVDEHWHMMNQRGLAASDFKLEISATEVSDIVGDISTSLLI